MKRGNALNILLVNPSQSHVYGKLRPALQISLGLAYVAGSLRQQGYCVDILDINLERITKEQIKKRVVEKEIRLVGITATTPAINNALTIARLVKQVPGVQVILGGVHPTIMPYESMSETCVDFCVIGEGEVTIVELIQALEAGRDLKEVKGIAFRKDGLVIKTAPRVPVEDLDSLPPPARDLFPNHAYTYPDSISRNTVPMITSRGCFGKCNFCLTPVTSGGSVRLRSAKSIVDEMEFLINTYRAKEIHLWDDNFIASRKRVYEVRDQIKQRGIKVRIAFPNGIRADFINEEILKCLKEMGTYSMAIGVESGNQRVLNLCNKTIKLEQIRNAVALMKKHRIETWAFFMFGLPGDNEETIQETIEFAKKLNPDIAKFHILKPFPGTEAFNYFKSRNLIDAENFDDYGIHARPVHHLENVSAERIKALQDQAYRDFYFNLKKIISHIMRLKSWNRLILNLPIALGITKKALISSREE